MSDIKLNRNQTEPIYEYVGFFFLFLVAKNVANATWRKQQLWDYINFIRLSAVIYIGTHDM